MFSIEEDDDAQEPGSPAWMATFSDMVLLMLTFFVMLLSFAHMDLLNFRVALDSVREAFGVEAQSTRAKALARAPAKAIQKPVAPAADAASLERQKMLAAFSEFVKARGLSEKVEVFGTPKGVVLRMKDIVLFNGGSDRLLPTGRPVLQMIADLFRRFAGQVGIEGHTDNRPIKSSRFRSNWELSSARATAALRYLVSDAKLDATRLHVGGYADTRPIDTNSTSEGRSKNRRVEFLFEYPTHGPAAAARE